MWEKVKNIPAFIAAIIAIIGAVGSAVIWTAGYFATTTALHDAECRLNLISQRNRMQIGQSVEFANAQDLYRLAIPLIEKKENGEISQDERAKLEDLSSKNKTAKNLKIYYGEKAHQLDEALKSGTLIKDKKCVVDHIMSS